MWKISFDRCKILSSLWSANCTSYSTSAGNSENREVWHGELRHANPGSAALWLWSSLDLSNRRTVDLGTKKSFLDRSYSRWHRRRRLRVLVLLQKAIFLNSLVLGSEARQLGGGSGPEAASRKGVPARRS